MNNLGAYQWFTKTAKKFHGVFPFLSIIAIGGYTVIRVIEVGGKKAYKIIRKRDNKTAKISFSNVSEYMVERNGKSNENITFTKGDKFCVLGRDGDTVLVDKLNDPNSPYFVSAKFLNEISEYDGK